MSWLNFHPVISYVCMPCKLNATDIKRIVGIYTINSWRETNSTNKDRAWGKPVCCKWSACRRHHLRQLLLLYSSAVLFGHISLVLLISLINLSQVISEDLMVNHFLPGLRCLRIDMEHLSPEHEVSNCDD